VTAVLIAIIIVAPIAFSIGVARGADRTVSRFRRTDQPEPRLDIGPALDRALRKQTVRRSS